MVLQDISALKELERQREEFISVVAHDLRSPLALIRGYADLIQKLPADGHAGEQEHRALAYIQEAVTRLDRLIGDLLDMSRIEARRLEL
ncbi:MAG: PAS domain-containing sensor histidine kinase, partial [Chloroflexota bacterium]